MRVLCFWVTLLFSLSSVAHDLNLEDLKSLAHKSQYKELLDRATDVAPQKRDTTWNELVTLSATKILPDERAFGLMKAYEVARVREQRFPHLLKSKAYKSLYTTLIVDAADDCLKGVSTKKKQSWVERCLLMAEKLRTLRPDAKTLGRLSSILWRGGAREQSVVLLNDQMRATARPKREALCEKDGTLSSTEFALGLSPKSKGAKAGVEIAAVHCATLYAEDMALLVSRANDGNRAQNLCPSLLKLKSTKGLLRKRCERAIEK